MRQTRLILWLALFLAADCTTAWAQLNSNPWLNANDKEDVAEVYAKRARRRRGNTPQNYQTEESVTIDRTHAYIQDTEEAPQDESLLDKIKSSISSEPQEEKPLIANTQENRQKLAAQKQAAEAAQAAQKNDNMFALPDINRQTKQLKRNITRPLIKAQAMFNKFKRTTANSLRAIGKQFK